MMKTLAMLLASFLVLACGDKPEMAVVGKWAKKNEPDKLHFEFFEDGTFRLHHWRGLGGRYELKGNGVMEMDFSGFRKTMVLTKLRVSKSKMSYNYKGEYVRYVRIYGEKSSSEGSESAKESPTAPSEAVKASADTAKPPPAESPVAKSRSEEASDTPNSLSDADVERLLKEALRTSRLQERDGRLYQGAEWFEAFSGWKKEMWDSERVKKLIQVEDGKLDGLFMVWHPNGQKRYEGTYKDGKKDGLRTEWYGNGQKRAEVTFKDGKDHGPYRSWYKNGQKLNEGTFKDNKREGLWTAWSEDGQKEEEGTYKDGKRDGHFVWCYENGQKRSEGTYKDGKRDGYFVWCYENGQKGSEGTFKDGKAVSTKYWNPIGEKAGEVVDGNGVGVAWHENGQKKSEVIFKDGEAVSVKYWNSKGEEVETGEESEK